MTWPQSELPRDIAGCRELIRQLQSDIAGYQETIATQQETIDALAAENKLLKRSLLGSRRERFTEDPAQGLLFDFKTLGPASAEQATDEAEAPPSKPKRTSKGRQRRVFPDFMPREEEPFHLQDAEIPESMRDNPLARRFFKHVGERIEMIPAQFKVVTPAASHPRACSRIPRPCSTCARASRAAARSRVRHRYHDQSED